MPTRAPHQSSNRKQPIPPIDEEEREIRQEIVEEALEIHERRGYGIDWRVAQLLNDYLDGKIDDHELTASIVRPYLH